MKKEFTCIVCPEGCTITVDDGGGELAVSGNKCPRGAAYVKTEAVAPVRNISTTVRLTGGKTPVFPVKTAAPVPKEKIFEVMAACRGASAAAPVRLGQVIIQNAAGTGADIVATADAE